MAGNCPSNVFRNNTEPLYDGWSGSPVLLARLADGDWTVTGITAWKKKSILASIALAMNLPTQ